MAEDYVEVYERAPLAEADVPLFDWRRIDGHNGQVIATSGNQGYVDQEFCIRMARRCNAGVQVRVLNPGGGYEIAKEQHGDRD